MICRLTNVGASPIISTYQATSLALTNMNHTAISSATLKITDGAMKLIDNLDTVQTLMDDVRLVLEQFVKVQEELPEDEYERLDGTPLGVLLDKLEDLRYEIEQA